MPEKYLIWSNEHRAFWGPARVGYYEIISKAGRYDYETARRICDDANIAVADGEEPNEVMLLAPESLSHPY